MQPITARVEFSPGKVQTVRLSNWVSFLHQLILRDRARTAGQRFHPDALTRIRFGSDPGEFWHAPDAVYARILRGENPILDCEDIIRLIGIMLLEAPQVGDVQFGALAHTWPNVMLEGQMVGALDISALLELGARGSLKRRVLPWLRRRAKEAIRVAKSPVWKIALPSLALVNNLQDMGKMLDAAESLIPAPPDYGQARMMPLPHYGGDVTGPYDIPGSFESGFYADDEPGFYGDE